MSWKIVKIVGVVVLIALIGILSVAVNGQKKHISTLKEDKKEQSVIIKHQAAVIDSLVSRKTIAFNVSLDVTDKSVNKINAKKSSGIVSMPQENTYTIKLDSGTINLLNGK